MSTMMEDDIKRWTAKRKTALVLDIIQGKTTISEASRAYDLNPSEVEQWVDEGKRGMENALRTKPLECWRQQPEQSKRPRAKSAWNDLFMGSGYLHKLLSVRIPRTNKESQHALIQS